MPLSGWERVPRTDPYYQACVTATTVVGAGIGTTLGSVAIPGLGTVAGWAGGGLYGFAVGYLACPYLAPGIKRKIEADVPLTLGDVRSAAEAMGRYASVDRAGDAIKLVSFVRYSPKPSVSACTDPTAVARKLLGA